MTAPLGSRHCIRTDLACRRERYVSPTGIRYSTCLAHAKELLRRATAPSPDLQQGARAAVAVR